MIERSLVLVKPDGVYRAIIGKVIDRFETAGLKVVALKMLKPSSEFVGNHYAADDEWLKAVGTKAKASYTEKGIKVTESEMEIGHKIRMQLIDFLANEPVVAMVVEGNCAISIIRKIVGSTEPKSAESGSIRGMFSNDSYDLADKQNRAMKNIIHASSSVLDSKKEIDVWFKKNEILDYKRADESIQY